MKKIQVVYYALLRQERGLTQEKIESAASTARELYDELRRQHQFKLQESQVRVAINSAVSSWDAELNSGDTVMFIPPVAGG